jgi:hypothetical protein
MAAKGDMRATLLAALPPGDFCTYFVWWVHLYVSKENSAEGFPIHDKPRAKRDGQHSKRD